MNELDEIIHQPLRLKIMAALNALPAASGLEFVKLKQLTGATDGNLGAHIETLANMPKAMNSRNAASILKSKVRMPDRARLCALITTVPIIPAA